MSVEAIAAVGAQLATTAASAVATPNLIAPPPDAGALASMPDILNGLEVRPGDNLFDRLVDSLGEIDAGMQRSREATTELALGQTDHLHQMLIDAERTRLQFDLAMSMRNRVLEAYQEIMRMQV
jgi:flagellar hook-basal body complex protein FliE